MTEIRKFTFDGDQMSIYGLIEELNEELEAFGLSLKVDDEVHDGYDVAVLSRIETLKTDK